MIDKQRKLKLELVQINGIVKLLLDKCDEELLCLRIESNLGLEVKDVKKTLSRMSRNQLILLVEQSSEICNEDIDYIYELNRYGLKPGFTLYYINGKCLSIETNKLKEILNEKLASIENKDDSQFKDIKCKSVECIVNSTVEISLSYLSKHTYMSEEEKPEYIYEFKETFVWVSTKDMFVAIKNEPNKVMTCLKNVLATIYNAKINTVRLTKRMVQEIFGENNIKKGTYYKPNANSSEAQKVTIADANLAEKPQVRKTYSGYDLTSSSLEEEINDDIISTLGINCKQGKIYLTKNLNATDFRTWSVKRINDVIAYIDGANLEKFDEFQIRNIMEDAMWIAYNKNQKNCIEKIIFTIYCAKKHGLECFELGCTISELLQRCNKFFYTRISFECVDCEEISIPHCIHCESSSFIVNKNGRIVCGECGNQQENKYVFQCEEGHENKYIGYERIVELCPNIDILIKIKECLDKYFDIKLSEHEYFYIHDGKLILLTGNSNGNLLNTSEVKEFDNILHLKIERDEKIQLLIEFNGIKEKCKKHENKACNNCMDLDENCIMKLFSVFGFRPSPHQNSEFGDVNMKITCYGEQLRMVGIAKSRMNKDTLSVSTSTAREIIQQVLTMSHDVRADVITIICPMRFHPQLAMELEYIAKVTRSKIMYLDDEFMIRLLKYYQLINVK